MSLKTLVGSGSGIQKKKKFGSGINHIGSATLQKTVYYTYSMHCTLNCVHYTIIVQICQLCRRIPRCLQRFAVQHNRTRYLLGKFYENYAFCPEYLLTH